ncbi:MAG: hypothetical protein ACSLFO_06710 [Acidimicrobiales bacterium]
MQDLEAVIDYAERPRVDGWSLRAALVRYAQPEPARAGAVLELVRRTDGALKPHLKRLARDPHLLTLTASDQTGGDDATVVALLRVALVLDQLGDVLAAWAAARSDDRPDAEIDAMARSAFVMLGDLGVARETRPPRRS